MSSPADRTRAVSYTHLDVHKRQAGTATKSTGKKLGEKASDKIKEFFEKNKKVFIWIGVGIEMCIRDRNEDGGKRRNAAKKKELDAAEKRIAELSAVFKRLYDCLLYTSRCV